MHASKRDNCQQCWRSSKKVIHSSSVILAMRVSRRFHEANIVVIPCKRAQHYCATFGGSQNFRNVGTCCAKKLTGFKLYATSTNMCRQVPTLLWFHATDATCWAQQGCVFLANNVACCRPTMLRPFAWAWSRQEGRRRQRERFKTIDLIAEYNHFTWECNQLASFRRCL